MSKTPRKKTNKPTITTKLSDVRTNVGTKIVTEQAATKRSKRLYRAAAKNGGERLRWCHSNVHCRLLSCPGCRWREQAAFIKKTKLSISADENPKSITILPEFGISAIGELPCGGLRGFKDQIRSAIRKEAPELNGVFCIDVSLELGPDKKAFWHWHVHGVVTDWSTDALNKVCRRFTWQQKGCRRPVVTKRIFDLHGQLSYMSKPQFFRRHPDTDTRGKKVMTIEQELQLARLLSRYKATGRIFYMGAMP